jgi:hypothetical protein
VDDSRVDTPEADGPSEPRNGRELRARRRALTAELACAALLPATWLAQQALAIRPDLVERVYARTLFPPVARALGAVSALSPVSLAEVLLGALGLWLAIGVVRFVRSLGRTGPARAVGRGLLRLAALSGVLYLVFVAAWGLNHQRLPFAEVAGYDTAPPTTAELDELATALVDEVNRLRPLLEEDASGVSRLPHDEAELLELLCAAYDACGGLHPSLFAPPGVPRRPALSPVLSAWWISGIYSPFTAEAHVNAQIPESQVAFSIAHELAHSLGFARENEANYVAWLACSRSDDPTVRYSGYRSAAMRVLSALSVTAPERALELVTSLHPGVERDRGAISAFWQSKESVTTAAARGVNDAYLKSQGHAAGIESYGMFVDLLVAEQRPR